MIAAVDPATQVRDTIRDYIDGVRSGSIVTGKLVRLAVERHCWDLEHAHERGLVFDADVATRSCLFFPMCLAHSIGEFAAEPFALSPWQTFVTWCLFGWQKIKTRTRRFRKAYISVARKNGKTTYAAGLALKSFFFDEPFEPAAQVYCVATREDQAKLLYREAERMVKQSPDLMRETKIRKAPAVLEYKRYDSMFRALGSDSDGTDGLNPHCIIEDELHAWREHHRGLKEKLATAGGARRQPLEIVITTAGDADSQLWIEEDEYARSVVEAHLSGAVFDDSYFAFCACIDEGDDPFDERNWAKANPNIDVSVKREYLQQQAKEAQNQPSKTNQFLRYHCNIKTEATERAISPEAWAMGSQPLDIPDGAYGHGGIDVGRSDDWCGVGLCFPSQLDTDGKATRWQFITRAWTCSEGRFNLNAEPFRSWAKAGLLQVCRGNIVDMDEVEDWIIDQHKKYRIETWAFDKTFAREMTQRLQDAHGFKLFEYTQSHRFYNEPFRRLIAECAKGNIIHGGDPVFGWQASNVQVNRNARDEWMPDKANPKKKIDAFVGALMAFSECLFAERLATGSLVIT